MRRYQVVFSCVKTSETKIDIIINSTFQGAYTYSKNKAFKLKADTLQEWVIASICDLEVEFELHKKLY
jgi:hypothetical protein|tara:strand:- start:282 stop:485 length:204 start_codon:yes stop_codon:yes gene_type:complete